MLPNTTVKGAVRRWPLYALAAAALVALALLVEAFIRAESFSPGREEIVSPAIRDVAVSARDELYPPPDTSRFEGPPETVFVYLSVEGLPAGGGMEARVQRAGSGSAFSLLLGGEGRIEALDEQEDQLRSTENGATGIVKFALGSRSGDSMPPGNYTIDILNGPESDAVAARKFFVVEE